ncbi:phage virion morphogenesis protein [Chryseosolibacter indicus]|uniref:Phage virion morphogenesis protein n=1 Tax=Chryseosolibacter indicus TaxID=2782351 RepID=A0ABS5VND5_9BACT|nr:phage virion morphogenesis protein [Chryseosolibacter indicus]MBT1702943.1 phage virion morphogenesis protein [Chryseosolibacter indicus]
MTPEEGIRLLQGRFKGVMTRLPVLIGNVAVNFSLDNFRRQGFLSNTLERWPARRRGWRKDNRPNRNILINTGRLRRSIRIIRVTPSMVVVGSDVKYARVHNEGMRIGQIQSVKGHTRKNGSTVKPHTRRIDQNIPRRRFMGNSPYLNAMISRTVSAEFMKALK